MYFFFKQIYIVIQTHGQGLTWTSQKVYLINARFLCYGIFCNSRGFPEQTNKKVYLQIILVAQERFDFFINFFLDFRVGR